MVLRNGSKNDARNLPQKMLSVIFLASSISMAISVGYNECDGKEDNFRFYQGCNECWCQSGKPVCTNKGCVVHKLMKTTSKEDRNCNGKKEFQFFQSCNECWCRDGKTTCTNKGCNLVDEERDSDDDNMMEPSEMQMMRENAIGKHAWDLEDKFPEKEKMTRPHVTPYPLNYRYRFNLQPALEKLPRPDTFKYPPVQAHHYSLNVPNTREVWQYPKYQQYPQYPGYSQYQVHPVYKLYPASGGFLYSPLL